MKAKQIFLSIVAFTLLLATFCVVVLTANYTETFVDEPVRHQSTDPGEGGLDNTFVRASAGNLSETVEEPETKKTLLAASIRHRDSHFDKPEMEAWSAEYQEIRPASDRPGHSVESDEREHHEGTTDAGAREDDKKRASEGVE